MHVFDSIILFSWALLSVGLFLQRYFEYEFNADNIPINQDTLIKFDRQDCTYKIPFISTYYIHFTVVKYSDAEVSLSFYQTYDQGKYMGRLTSCFAAVGKSCSLEVPRDGNYLVARADDVNKMKDEVTGKFIWRCGTHHYSIDTIVKVVFDSFCFFILPLAYYLERYKNSSKKKNYYLIY